MLQTATSTEISHIISNHSSKQPFGLEAKPFGSCAGGSVNILASCWLLEQYNRRKGVEIARVCTQGRAWRYYKPGLQAKACKGAEQRSACHLY